MSKHIKFMQDKIEGSPEMKIHYIKVFHHRYIAAGGYVIDTLLTKMVYHYSKDLGCNYKKNMRKQTNDFEIMKLIKESDAPYESDDFISCAKVAQVTL